MKSFCFLTQLLLIFLGYLRDMGGIFKFVNHMTYVLDFWHINWSSQIIIFHVTNPRFPWNKRISLHQLPFGVFGCVRSRWNLIRSDGKGTVLDSTSTISSNALRKSCSWAFFLGCMQSVGPKNRQRVLACWLVAMFSKHQNSHDYMYWFMVWLLYKSICSQKMRQQLLSSQFIFGVVMVAGYINQLSLQPTITWLMT